MIARRLRLSFLNSQAALEALPNVIDIMGEELKWSDAEKKVRMFIWRFNFFLKNKFYIHISNQNATKRMIQI